MYAVVVLERLPEPGVGGDYAGDPIMKAYRKLLEVERNKDVRKAILGAMPIVAGATIQVAMNHPFPSHLLVWSRGWF